MTPRFFPREDYAARLNQVHRSMEDRAHQLLLITAPEDIFYLSGHHTQGYYTYQALLVPVHGAPLLIGRRGELVNASTNSWLNHFVPYDDTDNPIELTAKTIHSLNPSAPTIGVDFDSWFFTTRNYLELSERLHSAKVVDSKRLVGNLRVIKSPREVEYIRSAARFAEKGMEAGIDAVRPGAYDHEVAAAILGAMMHAGSNYLAMEPFVAVGERSGNMHSAWDNRQIQNGDVVFLEVPGCCNRYHAALTRCIYLGKEVSSIVAQWADVCSMAVAEIIRTVRPGVTSNDVAQAVAKVPGITEEYQQLRKRVGYSMGIAFAPDWGEGHLMDLKADDARPLRAGMVFHVPVALRTSNTFGVGFSEMIHVTQHGAEKLTQFPDQLFVKS